MYYECHLEGGRVSEGAWRHKRVPNLCSSKRFFASAMQYKLAQKKSSPPDAQLNDNQELSYRTFFQLLSVFSKLKRFDDLLDTAVHYLGQIVDG